LTHLKTMPRNAFLVSPRYSRAKRDFSLGAMVRTKGKPRRDYDEFNHTYYRLGGWRKGGRWGCNVLRRGGGGNGGGNGDRSASRNDKEAPSDGAAQRVTDAESVALAADARAGSRRASSASSQKSKLRRMPTMWYSYMQKISRHLFIHVGNARYFVLLPLIMNALRAVLLLICHFVNKCQQWRSTAIISPK
jgi:hypothetical protein